MNFLSKEIYVFFPKEISFHKKNEFSLQKKYVVSFNTTKEIFLIIG